MQRTDTAAVIWVLVTGDEPGLDDNQWDGFCRTINSNAQSLCHHNPFTGNDTTDSGLK
ncbi:hypothetical protein [Spirillospora sp. NPDC077959]|uniref:hypothetical protein n=1 Tax=Spirillospora sp. NPDC077959 TaxID=3364529 RepID=UPI0037D10B98